MLEIRHKVLYVIMKELDIPITCEYNYIKHIIFIMNQFDLNLSYEYKWYESSGMQCYDLEDTFFEMTEELKFLDVYNKQELDKLKLKIPKWKMSVIKNFLHTELNHKYNKDYVIKIIAEIIYAVKYYNDLLIEIEQKEPSDLVIEIKNRLIKYGLIGV